MKNRHLISFLFISFIGISGYGQTKQVINFQKVYEFINSTMTNDTLKFNLSDETESGMLMNDTASIFSDSLFKKEDVKYFREQVSLMSKMRWQKGRIKGSRIIPNEQISKIFKDDNGWDEFRKRYGECLSTFTLPIFNKKFDYCIFYHWTQCDYLFGSGRVDLFQYVNGKWVFVKSYSVGVS